jgi:hypothetical protein
VEGLDEMGTGFCLLPIGLFMYTKFQGRATGGAFQCRSPKFRNSKCRKYYSCRMSN